MGGCQESHAFGAGPEIVVEAGHDRENTPKGLLHVDNVFLSREHRG